MGKKDGVLHCRVFRSDGGEKVLQVVLPSLLHHKVLTLLHQEHGHQGVERTTELVRQRCYWPGLTLDVVQCVKSVTGARPPTTGKSVYTIAPVDDLGRVRCVNRPALFPLSQALDNYFNTLVVFSGREFY